MKVRMEFKVDRILFNMLKILFKIDELPDNVPKKEMKKQLAEELKAFVQK